MKEEAKEVFEFLLKAITDINARWIISKQLFSEEKVIEVLNLTAPSAFAIFFWSLYDSIIMGVGRITDQPGSSNRNYFTLLKLCSLLNNPQSDRVKNEITKHEATFKPIRDRRDQQKAHNDRVCQEIPLANRKEIDAAINALTDIVHFIEKEFKEPYYGFEHTIMDGDGNTLVKLLEENVIRNRRNHAGSAFFLMPNYGNIDNEVYELTALKRDPNKTIVFPNDEIQAEVLGSIFELFGLVSEISNKP